MNPSDPLPQDAPQPDQNQPETLRVPYPNESLPEPTPAFGTSGGGTYGAYPTDATPLKQEVSLEAISEAWKLLQPNILVWMGATFAYIFILFFSIMLTLGTMALLTRSNFNQVNGAAIGVLAVCFVLLSVVSLLLSGGLCRMALENARTGTANFSLLFNPGHNSVDILVATILSSLLIFVGYLCCIVPGVVAHIGLMFTVPLVIDKKLGGIEAMSKSWELIKPQWMNVLVVILVMGLATSALSSFCGLAVLVTLPMTMLTLAVVYFQISGIPIAGPHAPSIHPVAPIADPNQ